MKSGHKEESTLRCPLPPHSTVLMLAARSALAGLPSVVDERVQNLTGFQANAALALNNHVV